MKKVIGISGSYRKNGIIDQVLDIMLNLIKENGLEVEKIVLKDKNFHYCRNCRKCTQNFGDKRGECVIKDDMESILDEIEKADAIIIGSPMNFGSITAITKAFKERLVCYAYWPWGRKIGPKSRKQNTKKRAILIWSCNMPAIMAIVITKISKELKGIAKVLGFETVSILKIGLVGIKEYEEVPDKLRKKSEKLAKKLIISCLEGQSGHYR